ncbi:hypothetical protein CI109_104096 [Kwoniella shandongensis]|uniref:Uncharacterized protein n=1 Tax=Kwoniella shandongensis TaxID=1734106 RepID=A0A5M6BYK6_9TREE|nr:uncharacterized protein CI109_004019 [Kwoniella shandongensis]KAA5527481.1 hypothetical protein CI109_004019 [Kwoniella shandongensis]
MKMNITVDDTSPQFEWSPSSSWTASHSSDPSRGQYYQQTYHSTSSDDASFTFRFNGTAIYIYGARRSEHGTYSVQLDEGDVLYTLGYDDPDRFQTLLYTAGGLSHNIEHVITLTNLPSKTASLPNHTNVWGLDIDYVVVSSPIVGSLYTSKYDNVATTFAYSGKDWIQSAEPESDGYYNGTNALTHTVGDGVTFSFSGSSVQLFGTADRDRGNYSVKLDSGVSHVFNGSSDEISIGTSLYVASNLTDEPHTLHVTNLGGSGTVLDIDYAVVNSSFPPLLDDSKGIVILNNSLPTAPRLVTPHHSTNITAALAGGVIGGVVLLLVTMLLLWCCVFRRKKERGSGLTKGAPVDLYENEEKGKTYQVDPYPINDSSVVQEQWHPSIDQEIIERERQRQLARTPSVAGTSVHFPPSPTRSNDRLVAPAHRRSHSYAESTTSSICCGCDRHSHSYSLPESFGPTSPALNTWSRYPLHPHQIQGPSGGGGPQSPSAQYIPDMRYGNSPTSTLDNAPPSPPFRTAPLYIPTSYPLPVRTRSSGSFSHSSPTATSSSIPMTRSPSNHNNRRMSTLSREREREIDAGPVSPTIESEDENSQGGHTTSGEEDVALGLVGVERPRPRRGILPPDYEQATERMLHLNNRERDAKSP